MPVPPVWHVGDTGEGRGGARPPMPELLPFEACPGISSPSDEVEAPRAGIGWHIHLVTT